MDLKAQLKKAEQDHYEKVNKVAKLGAGLSNSFKDDNDEDQEQEVASAAGETSAETPLERKRRLLQEAERLDKDDSDDSDASKDSDDSDSDDSDRYASDITAEHSLLKFCY